MEQHCRALREQIEVCGLGKEAPFPADGYRTNLGEGDDDVTDKALLKVLRQAKSDGVKFLFVILKSHSKAIHSRLKYFGDIIVGQLFGTESEREY